MDGDYGIIRVDQVTVDDAPVNSLSSPYDLALRSAAEPLSLDILRQAYGAAWEQEHGAFGDVILDAEQRRVRIEWNRRIYDIDCEEKQIQL